MSTPSNTPQPDDLKSPKDSADLPSTIGDTQAYDATAGGVPDTTFSDHLLGNQIGRYTLIKKLGEGGMGSVYLAEQSEPVKRQVALKLIRGHYDSRTILARFEAERQALAVMDHPNIARIYDGGTSSSQQPYFVMELVQGVPITEYCDQHRLSPKQRLELFVPICQAVQHAHQKGIIHRDLKPSNVLVTEVDGKPIPKVIDFGVAKATEQPLTDQSLGDTGAVVGTPTYMSPEQADPESMDIDTRTDIYALGVMLYELLTGSTPIDAKQFRRGALLEVLRMVREMEPPRPSTKLSTTEALPSIAANRNVEPGQLQAMLRGDIDWIVMKALDKDRSRRYETANGFAADVQRYLSGAAVLAHPPSRWYLVKKFVRRNRLQMIAAGLVIGALVVGMVVSLWQMNRALVAEERAKSNEQQAEAARDETKRHMEMLLGMVTDIDYRKIRDDNKPLEAELASRLVLAGKQLESQASNDLLGIASLLIRLGQTLQSLGYSAESIPLLMKAREILSTKLGVDHLETLKCMGKLAQGYRIAGKLDLALSINFEVMKLMKLKHDVSDLEMLSAMNGLAGSYLAIGKLDQALPLYEESFRQAKAKLGIDHQLTLIVMGSLARGYQNAGKLNQAVQLYGDTLRLMQTHLGTAHPETLTCMNNLAMGYQAAGKLEQAIPLFEETLKLKKAKLGDDHPGTHTSMSNLANAYRYAGKLNLAIPLCEESLKLSKAKLGPDHPDTLISMNNLAECYRAVDKLQLALPLYEETLRLSKAKLGPDHPDTLSSMNNLAVCYSQIGKFELGLSLHEETLKLTKAKLGAEHLDTLGSMANLATSYEHSGKMEKALQLNEEAFKLMKTKLGADHPDTLVAMNNLAKKYQIVGKMDLALPLKLEVVKLMTAKLGPDHPNTLGSMFNLAAGYQIVGKLDLALPLFEEAAKGMEKQMFQHNLATRIVNGLIECQLELKQFAEAESWRRKLLAVAKQRSGVDSLPYASELAALGLNLLQQKQWADAEPVLRESLALRERKDSSTWTTFNTQSMLGGALLGQKKYPEAEQLLLKGYEGMVARLPQDPPGADAARLTQNKTLRATMQTRLVEALDRLIQFYTETNKPDEVKKWQAEKDKLLSKNRSTLPEK